MMTDTQIKSGTYNCPNCGAAATPSSVRCAYCHSSLATLVCSRCYGAIFVGMKHCPWCGENAEAGKSVEGEKGKCPRCTVSFLLVKVNKKLLSECPACGGLWVDGDTLQEICDDQEQLQAVMGFNAEISSPMASGSQPGRAYIPCPVCGKLMNRRQFAGCSHVVVDWCKAHGTWFDRNELHQVVQFILDGGLKKSREREKLMLEEEKQRLRNEMHNLGRLSSLEHGGDFAASQEGLNRDLCKILGGIWHSLGSKS